MRIHVATADSKGIAAAALSGNPCDLKICAPDSAAQQKSEYVKGLSGLVIAIGNDDNDHLMLRDVAFGIAVVGGKVSESAIRHADMCVPDAISALDLIVYWLSTDSARVSIEKICHNSLEML